LRDEFRRPLKSERLEQASFFFPENLGRVTGKSPTSSGVADLHRYKQETINSGLQKAGYRSELACLEKQSSILTFGFHELLLDICSDNSF